MLAGVVAVAADLTAELLATVLACPGALALVLADVCELLEVLLVA